MSNLERSSSLLRRSLLQSTMDPSERNAATDMYSRVLSQNETMFENTKGIGSIIGLAVLGLFIVCFVYYSSYEICRFYWCPNSASEDSAVLVTDGFTFTLTAEQRRDVLEAIFSDTSKVSSLAYTRLQSEQMTVCKSVCLWRKAIRFVRRESNGVTG